MNKIFIVSSVSASGKSTLVDHAIKKLKLYRLKTCTTRKKRKEEKGDEYFFLSKEVFEFYAQNDAFVEWSIVYDKYYGLLKQEVENNADKNCIAILDVQGTEKLKKIYPEAITIFIEPPDKKELFKRLGNRLDFNSKNRDKFDDYNRVTAMKTELLKMKEYDHVILFGPLNDMKESFIRLLKSMCS